MAFWIGLSKNGLIAVLVVSSTDCLTENQNKWHWSEVQYIPQSVQFTVSSVRAYKHC